MIQNYGFIIEKKDYLINLNINLLDYKLLINKNIPYVNLLLVCEIWDNFGKL